MGRSIAVFRASLGAVRRSTVWWSVGLGVLVALTVGFWPAFRGASGISQAIDSLPAPIVDALGMRDFGTPAGFLRGNLYELFVPLLLSIAGIVLVNGQTASDEAAGRLELFLAQPVGRPAVFAGRFVAALTALAAIAAFMAVVQLGSDRLADLQLDAGLIASTIVLCTLLAAFHASLAYLFACLWPRPSLVLGLSLVVVIGGYVVSALFPISSALKPLRIVSPWNWALAGNPLEQATDPWRYAVLVIPALALAVLGTLLVRRRDVAAA